MTQNDEPPGQRKSALQRAAAAFTDHMAHHRLYWLRVLCLALLGVAAEHLLDHERVLLHDRYKIYNVQTEVLYRSKPAGLNTVFVVIDDDAFWKGELARRIPLKRDWLAKLITAVNAGDPRAIVLDLDLRAPNSIGGPVSYTDYDVETGKLLKAVQDVVAAHRPLVLPKSLDAGPDGELHEQNDIFGGDIFSEKTKHVYRGYIQLPYDLRTLPLCWPSQNSHLDSLAFAMLHATYPDTYAEISGGENQSGCGKAVDLQWGRFIPPRRFEGRILPANAVLANDPQTTQKLAGSVVIICGTWHEHSYGTGPMVDVHDSPAGIISGAFVHENYYEAMIQGHYFDPLSDVLMDVIEVVLILASAALMLWKKSFGWRLFAAFLPTLFMVVCSYFLLQNIGAFFECSIPVIVLLCHMALDHVLEWRELAMKYEHGE